MTSPQQLFITTLIINCSIINVSISSGWPENMANSVHSVESFCHCWDIRSCIRRSQSHLLFRAFCWFYCSVRGLFFSFFFAVVVAVVDVQVEETTVSMFPFNLNRVSMPIDLHFDFSWAFSLDLNTLFDPILVFWTRFLISMSGNEDYLHARLKCRLVSKVVQVTYQFVKMWQMQPFASFPCVLRNCRVEILPFSASLGPLLPPLSIPVGSSNNSPNKTWNSIEEAELFPCWHGSLFTQTFLAQC